MRELAIRLAEEGVEWDWQRHQFRCFNHILNLAARAALDEIKDDINTVNIML
jgi:hypothetical protein